ncbi:natterin-3-like [Symphorus nematophorus]
MLIDEALLLPPVELANRYRQPRSFNFESANLKWQTWRGVLPNGAVSIYNCYTQRYDYICKYRCQAGFYNPRMGPYCHYPFARRVYRCRPFEILVNRDNFEILEWKSGSYGSVPQNSVGTCSGVDIYVGQNKYGLGKVHTKQRAFFLPWKRKEYWYRRSYQVLTINRGVISEHISDIKYETDDAKIFRYPPEAMRISTITNYACGEVMKTATLSKTIGMEHRWDTGFAVTVGVTTTVVTSVPFFLKGQIEFSAEKTMESSKGASITEEHVHAVSVELNALSNHYCRVSMIGFKYKTEIPYTA